MSHNKANRVDSEDRIQRGAYTLEFHWDAGAVPSPRQRVLAGVFDDMATKVWGIDESFFRGIGDDLFTGNDELALVIHQDVVVGFSIYRRLTICGKPIIFQRYTCIDGAHQGRGAYSAISRKVLARAKAGTTGPVYFSWRTRNPIIWFRNAAFCRSIVPDLSRCSLNDNLAGLALLVGHEIYPGSVIDPVTLVVHAVYPGGSGYRNQPHHPDPTLDELFFSASALLDDQNSLLGLGELQPQCDSLIIDGYPPGPS